MPRTGPKILIVDDDESLALLIKLRLSYLSDSEITTVHSGISALAKILHEPVDLLITDFSMPGMDGIALTERAQAAYPDLPVLMVTAFSRFEIESHLRAAKVQHIFAKPIPFRQLCAKVDSILQSTAA